MLDSSRKPSPRSAPTTTPTPSRPAKAGALAARVLVRPGGAGRGAAVHRQADGAAEGGGVTSGDVVPAGGGRPLDAGTRAYFEGAFGHDLSGVRLHTGAAADASARGVGALAYTAGRDVVFRAGAYDSGSLTGRTLLAHELAHTVQQSAASNAPPRPDRVSRPGDPDEREADRAARAAVAGEPAGVGLRVPAGAPRVQRWAPPEGAPAGVPAAPADPAAAAALAELLERRARDPMPRDSKAGKRLRTLFREHPELQPAADARVRADTAHLREDARTAVRAWLILYEQAAYEQAVLDWTVKETRRAGRGAPPDQAARLAEWKSNAAAQLEATRALAPGTLSAARTSMHAVMDASAPLAISQDDLLDELSDEIEDQQLTARRARLRAWEIYAPLDYTPTKGAEREHRKRAAASGKAVGRVKKHRAEEEKLSAAPEGETEKQRKERERKLGRARTQRTQAEGAREAAERRMTAAGAGSDAMRRYYASREMDADQARAELEPYAGDREWRLAMYWPMAADGSGAPDPALTEADRWWIYFQALQHLENGIDRFDQADTVNLVLKHRWKVAADTGASGVDVPALEVGTYRGHGLGQYDLAASIRTPITPVTPAVVDLSRVFGRGADGGPRLFTPLETGRYRQVDRVDPSRAEADVLAKLAYGYFGRKWKKDAIETFLKGEEPDPAEKGEKPKKRSPDATRVIAGLWFEGTVFGGKIDEKEVQPRIDAARVALESEVRVELERLGLEVKSSVPLFEVLDLETTKKSFGGTVPFNEASLAGQPHPKTGEPMTGKAARKLVRGVVDRVVAGEGPAADAIQALIAHLWPKYGSDRSGPAVQVIHHFREAGASQEAWIVVSYRHLTRVAAVKPGDPATPDAPLGQLGSTGNAVSPHIHMSIAVFDRDPAARGEQIPLGFMSPLDFFPMMRRARTLGP